MRPASARPRSRPRPPCASRAPSRPGPRRARSRWPAARASQPTSIASAASEAVPTPASRITGTPRLLDDQAQVVRVVDPHAAADRRAERHHRRAAGVLEPAGEDRVVVRVGQHGEAVGHERLGGLEQLGRVGQQRAVVADHLELHPVGLERLARELGGGDGLARGEAAGRVRAARRSPPPRARRRSSRARVGSTRRIATRGQLGARRRARPRAITSRLRKPPVPRIRRESSVAVRRSRTLSQPPCTALEHLDAAGRRAARVVAHSPRGTTSPSTATATPRRPRRRAR